MQTSWSKERVQALKRQAYAHREDEVVEELLVKMNLHLNNHERATLIHTKNEEWKEVETIAAEMNQRLLSLQVP